MLARYLTIVTVLSLTLAAALDLPGDHSIILLKANAASLGVVVCGLEIGLGVLEDLGVSRSVTCCGDSVVVLAEGAVDQPVKNVAGSTEVCLYLLRVSTGTTPGRAWTYLDTTTLMGLSATRTNTEIVVARGIALSTPKHHDKRRNGVIRISLGSGCEASNAAAAPKACE